MTIESIVENQGKLGKLKIVGKVRKAFTCHDCKKDFPIGSGCYDQSDYTGQGFFPEKIRMCLACGEIKINGGAEVKEKKVKPKKEKPKEIIINSKDGCGKDTEYPKPGGNGVWRCGEKAPVVGIIRCNKCGGLK